MSLRLFSVLKNQRFLGLVITTVIAGGSVAIAQERDRGRDGGGFRGFGGGDPRGGFGGGDPRGGFGGRGGVASTLMSDNARTEVGITKEQQDQIDKFNDERRNFFRDSGVDFRSMSDDERKKDEQHEEVR